MSEVNLRAFLNRLQGRYCRSVLMVAAIVCPGMQPVCGQQNFSGGIADAFDAEIRELQKTHLPEVARPVSQAETNRQNSEFVPTAKAIHLFESRVRANPDDHFSMVVCAQLHLREGREKSLHSGPIRAESLLRRAIDISPENAAAQAWLASALVAQHRFRDAIGQANNAIKLAPGNEFILSTKGDALLELGQVDEAERIFNKIAESVNTPGVLARQARVRELRGDPDTAIKLVAEALAQSIRHNERPETTAWYDYRLASLCLDQGRLNEAEKHAKSGLARTPQNSKLNHTMALVHMARGELVKARRQFENSPDLLQIPGSMLHYAKLLKTMGDDQLAAQWIENADRLMQREAITAGKAHFRDRALFLLNHNRTPQKALELAKEDFQTRQDVFAYDTLALAELKNGQHEKASLSIRKAMSLGTKDARLHMHAAQIARACEDPEAAKKHLEAARKINPYFEVLYH